MAQKKLKNSLEKAKDVVMTDKEKEKQRRSFVYGNLKLHNPKITRKDIDEAADRLNNQSMEQEGE